MTYEEYRDKISAIKAQHAVALHANESLYADIKKVIGNIIENDIDVMSQYNINLSYFRTIDLEKIARDSKYKDEILSFIDVELTKLCSLLDGVLQ